MQTITPLIRLTFALAWIVLAACGSETEVTTAAQPQPTAGPGTEGSRSAPNCLPAADVTAIVALEVREFPTGTRVSGDSVVCAYQGADNVLGVFVTTAVGPAEGSEEVFNDMAETVRLFLGSNAEPEAIEVGERGYAYGSTSRSVAAAVSGSRLYYAEVASTASADIGDQQAAMVTIIERLVNP